MNIFSETRFSQLDDDYLYHIKDYTLYRNDDTTRVSQNKDLLEAWQFIVVLIIIQDTHIVPIQMVLK